MRMGLTVAQVYQQIAAKLATDTTATTLKAGGDSYSVVIVDKTDTPTLDDISIWSSRRRPPMRTAAA